MGKAGRFACILLPMLCTLATLVCGILLLISGTNKGLGALQPFHLIRIDTREINVSGNKVPAKDLGIHDYYSTYMWNYCSGSIKSDTWSLDDCEAPKPGYSFNIENIVANEGNSRAKGLEWPETVKNVQKAINWVSKFMVAVYVLGFIATAVTFLIGWFGLLSRWGSCVTTIFAVVAFLFNFVGSICASALAFSMKGAFNKAFDNFGMTAEVGMKWIATTWLSSAFALGAALFWLFSTCCCSGRTNKVMKDGKKGKSMTENTGSYQRVASPYGGAAGQNVPMQPYGGHGGHYNPGFEPMRHGHV